jgi:hypothetical protein
VTHFESPIEEAKMGDVIGRFRVGSVEDLGEVGCWDYEHGESRMIQSTRVKLSAVTKETDSEPEQFDNRAFYRSTPKGQIELTIENPSAAEQFQSGDVFDVVFSRRPAP